ncbi:hypothetical protein ACIP4X_27500 [Streptomyces sp. NPDC088817]|uniref:hypothetical protein n=1 Tax=Streptomyces sp. NPDC088817 TaxID=3365907 RepID=UPI0037F86F70
MSMAITGICIMLGVLLGETIRRRRSRRALAQARMGQAVLIPIGAKRPNVSGRWSPGRVRADAEEFRREPRWPWTRLREIPADLRFVRVREQKGGRELLWLPAGVSVIECESSDGPVWLWAMDTQLEHVVAMVTSADR